MPDTHYNTPNLPDNLVLNLVFRKLLASLGFTLDTINVSIIPTLSRRIAATLRDERIRGLNNQVISIRNLEGQTLSWEELLIQLDETSAWASQANSGYKALLEYLGASTTSDTDENSGQTTLSNIISFQFKTIEKLIQDIKGLLGIAVGQKVEYKIGSSNTLEVAIGRSVQAADEFTGTNGEVNAPDWIVNLFPGDRTMSRYVGKVTIKRGIDEDGTIKYSIGLSGPNKIRFDGKETSATIYPDFPITLHITSGSNAELTMTIDKEGNCTILRVPLSAKEG